jgi:hypothetical protein
VPLLVSRGKSATFKVNPLTEARPQRSSGLDEFHPDTTSNPAPENATLITGPQSRILHALLNENGLGNRDDGLAWIGSRIGREIDSSKELTKAEASKVIEALNALSEPPADEQ